MTHNKAIINRIEIIMIIKMVVIRTPNELTSWAKRLMLVLCGDAAALLRIALVPLFPTRGAAADQQPVYSPLLNSPF